MSMSSQKEKDRPATTLLDALSLLSAGRLTVTLGGNPLLSARCGEKELDVDVSGAKEAGLALSKVVRLEGGGRNVLRGSESVAAKLSRLGWKLTLYDRKSRILTMGHGVSRLTGRVRVNPLRLKKLLGALE